MSPITKMPITQLISNEPTCDVHDNKLSVEVEIDDNNLPYAGKL